jgi:hypothetical protein
MKNPPFQCKEKRQGNGLFLEFIGPINETAALPPIDPSVKSVYVNLEQVKVINSIGTRTWCNWTRSILPSINIYLENCPILIVKSFALIRDFLTPNMVVMSFYVPYYADGSDERKMVLIVKDTHFTSSGELKLPIVCDTKGNKMKPEVMSEAYFAFLKRAPKAG